MDLLDRLQQLADDPDAPPHVRLGALKRLGIEQARRAGGGGATGRPPNARAVDEPDAPDPFEDMTLVEDARRELSAYKFARWCERVRAISDPEEAIALGRVFEVTVERARDELLKAR